VEPWRILAITFTNKAADELKRRLAAPWARARRRSGRRPSTAPACAFLRRDADRLGFTRSFTIYDTADSQSLVKRILRDRDLDEKLFPVRYVLSVISRAKDELQTPEQLAADAAKSFDARRTKVAEIYAEYETRLHAADAMDFDDLILNTVRLLQDNEDVRTHYQRKFLYVLVDEYQDTNNLQYLLASMLAGGRENICVVGDDDQSIYKFRGATIANILDFERSTRRARHQARAELPLHRSHPLRGERGHPQQHRAEGQAALDGARGRRAGRLHCAANESEEAQFIADRILDDYSRGTPWSDHAVLYRINAQSNQLEYALKRRGIPYRVYGGMKFFDRAEVKDILSYLAVIANPADELRLLRIVNVPARGIGQTSLERAAALAAREGKPLFEILQTARDYPELQHSAPRLTEFARMIVELRALSEAAPLDALYDAALERSGYVRALREKDAQQNESRLENVQELKSNILSFMQETGDSSLAGFLDEVALYTDLDQMDAAADSVALMTIHAAKGLNSRSLSRRRGGGHLPRPARHRAPGEMEEERRLCYVAITRAKTRLFLTCARQRMLSAARRTTASPGSWRRSARRIWKKRPSRPLGFSDPPRGYERTAVRTPPPAAVRRSVRRRVRAAAAAAQGDWCATRASARA
jgi:DNA helicase-2/ATP-dependent DNA helicase PcrA